MRRINRRLVWAIRVAARVAVTFGVAKILNGEKVRFENGATLWGRLIQRLGVPPTGFFERT